MCHVWLWAPFSLPTPGLRLACPILLIYLSWPLQRPSHTWATGLSFRSHQRPFMSFPLLGFVAKCLQAPLKGRV